jgi:HlyD family secretion protein
MVEIAQVERGPMEESVLEEGKTRVRNRYVLTPPVAGVVRRVPRRAGARIEAGKTVLAEIEPEPSGFLDPRSRQQAEARLRAAEAEKMRRDTEVMRVRAALELALKERDRAAKLKESGAISLSDWDTAENQARVTQREVSSAEFALQVAEFEVEQAEAALLQARRPEGGEVEPLRILAPVDGYILSVAEENERVVTPGTQIMEVGDTRDLEAEIELLSSDAVLVKPGADVSIVHWGGDRPLRGRVTVVEPGAFTKVSALGVEEQRVLVRVEFVEPLPEDHFLGDRYRVEARITTWSSDNVLKIPTGALFRRGSKWMTFLAEGGRAKLAEVEVGHNNGIMAEVLSGVEKGQQVIVHPPDSVTGGARIDRHM